MKTYWDKWENVMNLGEEMEVSSFSEIEGLIKRLDQSIYTQVILNGEDNYLLIGGGTNKYIVCFVIGNNEDFYTLINADKSDMEEEITIVTGGQEGSFPEKMVVDYDSVIKTSHYYYKYFDKIPDLLWVNE